MTAFKGKKQWDGLLLTLTASQCARLEKQVFQQQNEKEPEMKITRVGVDLAKSVFQVHGVDHLGHAVWKRQLKRSSWLRMLVEKLEPGCEIGMEACSGAHHWARELKSRGYEVKLIPPQFVKPYVKSQSPTSVRTFSGRLLANTR